MQLAPPPPLPVIKIFKYCGVWGGGRQNPTKDNGAPLSVIKMLSNVASGKGGALAALKTLPKKFQPLLKKSQPLLKKITTLPEKCQPGLPNNSQPHPKNSQPHPKKSQPGPPKN